MTHKKFNKSLGFTSLIGDSKILRLTNLKFDKWILSQVSFFLGFTQAKPQQFMKTLVRNQQIKKVLISQESENLKKTKWLTK